MPYIITTTTYPAGSPMPNGRSHIAVATLEEARDAADRIIGVNPVKALGQVNNLTADGGTVGPLPDGTVIEVRQVQWIDLARQCEMDCGDLCAGPNSEVLAVFNAR